MSCSQASSQRWLLSRRREAPNRNQGEGHGRRCGRGAGLEPKGRSRPGACPCTWSTEGPGPALWGAMESFVESLNRLKDIHENEVMGLQNKLLELNSERCRDAQRVEELCAKNHQLREQQKALKENLRALENRLRAGLCDRCMVTQELARKKQQEFESTLLQNLQHVFLLTNELTRLQEENDTLKEEVKRLRGPGPKPPLREGSSDPPSPRLPPSLGAQKATTEKPLGGHEEREDNHPERPVGYRTSPVAKISPGANLPEPRAPDMSPQHISNQLHGTIAVLRPGSRACSANRGSANGTPPLPPPRSSPPSPPCGHSLPLDSFLQPSQPAAKTCESLKHPLPAERLCLLNRHLALHLRSPYCSPRAPAAAPSGPQPQGLKTGEAEAWEEPADLLGLPGTLAGVRDSQLEGALHLLLAQQLRARGRMRGPRMRGQPVPGEPPPSPPASFNSEGPEGEAARTALPRGRHPQPTAPGSPSGKEATATQDSAPDKPLDLSERGRGRDSTPKPASLLGSLSPPIAHTPSPKPPQGAEAPGQPGAQGLSNGTKGARGPESEGPPTPAVRAPALFLASTQSIRLPQGAVSPTQPAPSAPSLVHPTRTCRAPAAAPNRVQGCPEAGLGARRWPHVNSGHSLPPPRIPHVVSQGPTPACPLPVAQMRTEGAPNRPPARRGQREMAAQVRMSRGDTGRGTTARRESSKPTCGSWSRMSWTRRTPPTVRWAWTWRRGPRGAPRGRGPAASAPRSVDGACSRRGRGPRTPTHGAKPPRSRPEEEGVWGASPSASSWEETQGHHSPPHSVPT
ncbi:RBBP8 N-terminal-like protein isoform X1 [Phacochoerus africanus]|uniref:RBBP8 N-terminal-like protein isoform X1 n=1 Tax=Phacochoerus africanus TaxID=41426 RepID=UPI001FDA5BE8|nr:RBBP8 N-terminal-like protein isoform X1 [Phacochoerus africanus]